MFKRNAFVRKREQFRGWSSERELGERRGQDLGVLCGRKNSFGAEAFESQAVTRSKQVVALWKSPGS